MSDDPELQMLQHEEEMEQDRIDTGSLKTRMKTVHMRTESVHWDKMGYTEYGTVCNKKGKSSSELKSLTCRYCYENLNEKLLADEGFDPYDSFENFRKKIEVEN